MSSILKVNTVQPVSGSSLTLLGGTTTTSQLILKTTSGVGTTGADIIFQTGNNGATEAMRILNSGYVGIGTTSPGYLLDIKKSVTGQFTGLNIENTATSSGVYPVTDTVAMYFSKCGVMQGAIKAGIESEGNLNNSYMSFWTLTNWSDTEKMRITSAGNVGIGTVTPQATSGYTSLTINGTSGGILDLCTGDTKVCELAGNNTASSIAVPGSRYFEIYTNGSSRVIVSSAGAIRFPAYGAGTLVTDGSGNITASSDEKLKDIQGDVEYGLNEVLSLVGKKWKWKSATKYDSVGIYMGYTAQGVEAVIPEAVGQMQNGDKTLAYHSLLPVFSNAIKELNDIIIAQNKRIEALEKK